MGLEEDVEGEAEVVGLVAAGEGEEGVAGDGGGGRAGLGRWRWCGGVGDGGAVGSEEPELWGPALVTW